MNIEEKMKSTYYRRQAEEIFNVLYDKEILDKEMSAEGLEAIKLFIADMIVLTVESAIKVHDLNKKLKGMS